MGPLAAGHTYISHTTLPLDLSNTANDHSTAG